MEQKEYKRLSLKERIIIETLLRDNRSKSDISIRLNRSRSTIGREINKWVKNPCDIYNAELAHWCAQDDYLNKRNSTKIDNNNKLKIYVYRGLIKKWSPEQISGRMKIDFPNNPILSISHEAIYAHIYNHPQASLNRKLIKLLTRHRSRRKALRGSQKYKSRIKDRVSIDERPKHVDNRLEVGHWEGDLMIGVKQSGAIGTLVERKTRYVKIIKIEDRKSNTVVTNFASVLNDFHHRFKKTLTYDNGIEMAYHKKFTSKTGMNVFFAHPYSSWERGTNENTNGLIRRYFPKGTDFIKVSQEDLNQVERILNNRPRKILGYRTANEMIVLEAS